MHLVAGVAMRLNEYDSPYAVLGNEMDPLPLEDIQGLYFCLVITAETVLTVFVTVFYTSG